MSQISLDWSLCLFLSVLSHFVPAWLDYIIGISVARNHITINPFSGDVLEQCAKRLSKFVVNKKTFQVPLDWKVDSPLLLALTKARIAELA